MERFFMSENNIIFNEMETEPYKTKEEEPDKYYNYSRLPNDEYITRHNLGIESNKIEMSMFEFNPFTKVFTLNINHYFPEGYNLLPFYKRVNIDSLSLGEINYNKYIVLKIISKIYQRRAILFLSEDEKKNILKISIYNYYNYYKVNKEEELQKIFNIGKYMICMNSFYKIYDSMDDGLRIESPAEIILLDNLNELNYFFDKNNNRNIKNLKDLGNFFMKKKVYEKAIYYYIESLKLINENEFEDKEEINIIVNSNLIEAYLKYGYYTKALLYSSKGFELLKKYNNNIRKGNKINVKIESQKQKILYRKIRALKGLRQYYKIYELLYNKLPKNFRKNNLQIFDLLYKEYDSETKIDEILSENELKNILNLNEFKDILLDLEEKNYNECGKYNFCKLLKTEQSIFNLDCGNYYSPKISLDFDISKGIILKANEFIHKGELIIAEKGIISMNVNSKENNHEYNILTGKKVNLEDDILSYNYILESYKKYPDDFKKLNLLYNGKNNKMNLMERFEKINEKFTQDKIANIIFKNRHTTRRCIYYSNEIANSLFFISSFLNHSCDNNIYYEGIGDFIFCFSIKDISKGEELTLTYVDTNENYIKRKEKLSNWGIKCNCNFCQYDLKTMNEDYKIKFYKFKDFFENYKYKSNINEDNFKFISEKIKDISEFVIEYKNKLTPYEQCFCLIYILGFDYFINDIENAKLIREQLFNIENFNFFIISVKFFNDYLRFNRHLIDINYKDGHKLFNDSVNECVQYFKKLTPYDDNSIKEMLNLNIKQMEIDLKKINLK